jgi:hypothetical protein
MTRSKARICGALCASVSLFFYSGSVLGAASPAMDIDCAAKAEGIYDRFRVDTPLQKNAPIMKLEPDDLCSVNAKADVDKKAGGNTKDESSICRSTFIGLKEALGNYEKASLEACNKAKDVGVGCESETNQTACLARKAQAAANAKTALRDSLVQAKKKAAAFQKAAAAARKTYLSDLKKAQDAFAKNEAEMKKAQEAGDNEAYRSRLALRDSAAGVVNGELVKSANLFDSEAVTANRGGESTISGYIKKINGSDSASLVKEQETAEQAAKAFQATAEREIAQLNMTSGNLKDYSNNLNRQARLETNSITQPTISGNSLPTNLAAMAGPAAALARPGSSSGPSDMGLSGASSPGDLAGTSPTPSGLGNSGLGGGENKIPGDSSSPDSNKAGTSPDGSNQPMTNIESRPGASLVNGNGDLSTSEDEKRSISSASSPS